MSKKTERKNKTNLVVKWPTTPYFTHEDLFELQRDAKEITLRVRLSKEREKGRVVKIGQKTGGQGAPPKVYSFTPVVQSTLDLAKTRGIMVDYVIPPTTPVTPATPFIPKTQPVLA